MAKDKVSKFIDAYTDELGLDNEIRGYLKELIPNLAKKYEGTNIDIRQDNLQTYLINPGNEDYNLEDFFMNRLFHNVVQVRSEGSLDKHTKGHYVADSKMIELDNDRINNQIKFSKKSATELEEIKRNARKKVIMHEFEHGIQALFSEGKLSEGSKAICENIRKKLLKIDAGRYAEEISEEYNEQNMHGYEKLFISGGATVNIAFMEKGIVDNIILNYNPFVLNRGIPLFTGKYFENKLKLAKIINEKEDIVQIHYIVVK